VSDAIVAFHAQQAVEKSLKAVLASVGVDFPFTPNLAALFQLCEDAGVDVPPELEEAAVLTSYAVAARYGSKRPATADRYCTPLRRRGRPLDCRTRRTLTRHRGARDPVGDRERE